jgi:hypothetical protein
MLSAFLLSICCCVAFTIAAQTPRSVSTGANVKCQCYVVSGPEPGYFQYYRFWDFRSVPFDSASLKNFNFYPRIDNITTTIQGSLSANSVPSKSILLKDTPFANDWNIQNWHRKGTEIFPITTVNSNQNVFITKSHLRGHSTYLVLRTTRNENYSSTAEIESSVRNIFHCSLRVRFRLMSNDELIHSPPPGEEIPGQMHIQTIPQTPRPADLVRRNARRNPPPTGACAGIFTFNSTVSESDIEILTSDPPNRVHYANQPDYDFVTDQVVDGASIVKDIPIPWTSWATHRLDWFPGASRWYVNNQLQATNTYGVPDDPSRLIINLWSNGGVWSGNLTVGESVYMGIEFIELAYNVSGPYPIYGKGQHSSGRLAVNHTQPGHHNEREPLRANVSSKAMIASDIGTTKSRACKVGCQIDNVRRDGSPEVLWGFSDVVIPGH